MGLKDQNWSHFLRKSKPWREREEEEEEEEKKRRSGDQAKVWNLDFWYGN